MEKEIFVSEFDDNKVYQTQFEHGFAVDKKIISTDEKGDFVQFPLEDVTIRYRIKNYVKVITMRKDELDPLDSAGGPLGISYCFETPGNMWFLYKPHRTDVLLQIRQLFAELFVPDNISHNEIHRMNWFVSTLGIGPWHVWVKISHGFDPVEITEFTIPAPGTDPKSDEFKQYLSKLKQLGIKRVSKFRF